MFVIEPERYIVSLTDSVGSLVTDTACHILEVPIVIFLLKKECGGVARDRTVFDTKTSSWLSERECYVEEFDD